MAKAKKVEVSVSVDDSHIGKIDVVKSGLESVGLDVDRVHGAIGVITGKVDAAAVKKLHRVAGVSAVEESQSYQIAPPDADVQ
jgi:hypothetical protein